MQQSLFSVCLHVANLLEQSVIADTGVAVVAQLDRWCLFCILDTRTVFRCFLFATFVILMGIFLCSGWWGEGSRFKESPRMILSVV